MRSRKVASWKEAAAVFIPAIIFLALLLAAHSILPQYPMGWDYFYHKRVVDLSIAQQTLAPYDPLSGGGRDHSYIPSYYALAVAANLSSGIPVEQILRAASPLFGLLAAFSIWLFGGRTFSSALSGILFATSSEILLFSAASGLPSAASLFPLGIFAAAAFSRRKDVPEAVLLAAAALAAALHPLSGIAAAVLSVSAALPGSPVLLLAAAAPAIPGLWYLLNPITLPSWGLPATIAGVFSQFSAVHLAAAAAFLPGSLPALLALALFSALLAFSPLLPGRFAIFLAFPISLSAIRRRIPPVLAAAAILALALLVAPSALRGYEPLIAGDDISSLSWISENIRESSVVVGHTDYTAVFLMGRATTIIDGFSEGLPSATERQADISAAYSSGNFSRLASKYGARYIFTDDAERRLLRNAILEGSVLLDSGASQVLKLPY